MSFAQGREAFGPWADRTGQDRTQGVLPILVLAILVVSFARIQWGVRECVRSFPSWPLTPRGFNSFEKFPLMCFTSNNFERFSPQMLSRMFS